MGFLKRLKCGLIGLLAGELALLLALLPYAFSVFPLYAVFSFAGWLLIGVPIIALPSRIVAAVPLPAWMVIAAGLGPMALSLILLLLKAGFAHTAPYYAFSIVVSTICGIVYRVLVGGP